MEYFTEETDNTTKNIVHEIVRECAALDLEINPNFCTYYVKMITLDPLWDISPEKKIHRGNIQALVSFIMKNMSLAHNPSLTTMKVQQHFLSNFCRKKAMIQNQRLRLKSSAEPLLENLITLPCTDANKTRFFKRLVIYIALMIDLGNPKNYLVYKETFAVVKSLMNDTQDYIEFGNMAQQEKVSHIEYLQNISFGIRLFNRDSGRNIYEIDDMPKVISQALGALTANLQVALNETRKQIDSGTTAIKNMYYLSGHCNVYRHGVRGNVLQLNMIDISGITSEDVNHVIEMVVLYRQYEMYIRQLMLRLQDIEDSVKLITNEFVEALQKLRTTIKYSIGVAKSIVFPLMIDLGCVWRKFQDEFIAIGICSQIFDKLRKFLSNEEIDEEKLDKMVNSEFAIEQNISKIVYQDDFVCELLQESELKESVHLEFSGFCMWTFIATKGALIPGNKKIGILKWQDKYYSFAHEEAGYIFGAEPEGMILKAYRIIRTKPEIIGVLKMYTELYNCRHINIIDDELPDYVIRHIANKMYQTELHPVRTNIDPNYYWNTWEFYRQALKMGNSISCRDHSVQTIKSNFRYSVPVQTTELREKQCQTKKHNYMNVAKPSTFIFGLRGRKDDNQHIVDLTLPVDESPPQCKSAVEPYKIVSAKNSTIKYPSILELNKDSNTFIDDDHSEADYLNIASCPCKQEFKQIKK